MLSRRQFLLAAAGAIVPGEIFPGFLGRALSYLEENDEPLLISPDNPDHVLYAVHGELGEYSLLLDNPSLEPPTFTWREFMEHFFGSVENYLGIDELSEVGEVFEYGLDEEADWWTVLQCWIPKDSPEAQAFDLLYPLELGHSGNNSNAVGALDFIEGPMPGSNYRGVHAENALTLSILQHELLQLGQPVKVVLAS